MIGHRVNDVDHRHSVFDQAVVQFAGRSHGRDDIRRTLDQQRGRAARIYVCDRRSQGINLGDFVQVAAQERV